MDGGCSLSGVEGDGGGWGKTCRRGDGERNAGSLGRRRVSGNGKRRRRWWKRCWAAAAAQWRQRQH